MDDNTLKLLSILVDLIGKIVWPAVIFFAIVRFRSELSELITNLASVKVAGSEWVFQKPTAKAPEPTREQKDTKLEVGPDGFLSLSSVRAVVTGSNLLNADETITGELLLFQTPRQKTWLVATNKHVFILLDDEGTRETSRLIQTYFDRSKTLPIKCGRQDGAGIVKFSAQETWWYYSQHLFATPDALKDAVSRLAN
jgi:hypothetical protein